MCVCWLARGRSHLAALAGVNGDSFRMDSDTEDAQSFLKAHIAYISKL